MVMVCPGVFNHDKETEHVVRVGKKVLGEENVTDKPLPSLIGEDFSYFTKLTPGCFFLMSSQKKEGDGLHSNNFDVNDDVIPLIAEMWLRIAEDRFGVEFE
jgi:metal-dependent amidase/aminoacylase/carboxypeptidase family protein